MDLHAQREHYLIRNDLDFRISGDVNCLLRASGQEQKAPRKNLHEERCLKSRDPFAATRIGREALSVTTGLWPVEPSVSSAGAHFQQVAARRAALLARQSVGREADDTPRYPKYRCRSSGR